MPDLRKSENRRAPQSSLPRILRGPTSAKTSGLKICPASKPCTVAPVPVRVVCVVWISTP